MCLPFLFLCICVSIYLAWHFCLFKQFISSFSVLPVYVSQSLSVTEAKILGPSIHSFSRIPQTTKLTWPSSPTHHLDSNTPSLSFVLCYELSPSWLLVMLNVACASHCLLLYSRVHLWHSPIVSILTHLACRIAYRRIHPSPYQRCNLHQLVWTVRNNNHVPLSSTLLSL